MMYAKRNVDGEIIALSRVVPDTLGEDGASSWIAVTPDAEEVRRFGARLIGADSILSESDLGFIRVLEDLIDLLLARSVILFTDLPQAAQEKLIARRKARAGVHNLHLLDDERDEGLL